MRKPIKSNSSTKPSIRHSGPKKYIKVGEYASGEWMVRPIKGGTARPASHFKDASTDNTIRAD